MEADINFFSGLRRSDQNWDDLSNVKPGIFVKPGIILCMHPANERRHYNVTSSLIGWAHIHIIYVQNDPCKTR